MASVFGLFKKWFHFLSNYQDVLSILCYTGDRLLKLTSVRMTRRAPWIISQRRENDLRFLRVLETPLFSCCSTALSH